MNGRRPKLCSKWKTISDCYLIISKTTRRATIQEVDTNYHLEVGLISLPGQVKGRNNKNASEDEDKYSKLATLFKAN